MAILLIRRSRWRRFFLIRISSSGNGLRTAKENSLSRLSVRNTPIGTPPTTIRQTWAKSSTAVAAVFAGQAHGIGYVLTGTEIAAVDLDKCRDPETGRVDAWAQSIVDRAPGAYVEVTVSGTGLRVIGVGSGEAAHRKFVVGGDGAGVEVYRKATRFITVSCVQISDCHELTDIDDLIDYVVAHYGKANGNGKHEPNFTFEMDGNVLEDDIDQLIKNGAPVGQRSQAFSRVVWSLSGSGLSPEEIEQELRLYPNGIGAKYLAPDRLRQEIVRCVDKRGKSSTAAKSSTATQTGTTRTFPFWKIGVVSCPAFRSMCSHRTGRLGQRMQRTVRALASIRLVPLLGVASSLIGTARRIKPSKSWSEPFTMWTAIVGFWERAKRRGWMLPSAP